MKHTTLLIAAFMAGSLVARAQLSIPSDGSDGALNITEDTVIDLSQAVTGTWDQNNSANAGKGVYDPEKWAVVFKYTSVNIEGHTTGSPEQLVGRTVRFKNHPSHAPVVWLVQGNVTINGIVSVAGSAGTLQSPDRLLPTEPGPGGFRGGAYGPSGMGSGYGPGGGHAHAFGANYLATYGNPQIIPLIGGSGGGGSGETGSGCAAGGAILIAAAGNVTLSGQIDARGVNSSQGSSTGGAIKLIANQVSGGGALHAITSNTPGGRIRIETNSLSQNIQTYPETVGVIPANPPILWPAENAPKARVVSVDAVNAPLDPTSPLVAAADVAIQNNAPVNIDIETLDFPIEGVVRLVVIPKFGSRYWLTATRISGDINVATWRVTTTLPPGFVTLQARATQP
jgi:hypothetical protein